MKIKYENLNQSVVLIDVRTPQEYAEGTIGEAVNVPLYLDDQRIVVGTAYKQESPEVAKRIAMKYVSERLPEIYDAILELEKEEKPLVLFCARGGMRSQSLYQLLKSLGHEVWVIEGGYKAYRHVVIEETIRLSEEKTFVVLHGNTGVGKTYILNALTNFGEPVIDIEGLAKHRGSMLGRVGLMPQPTQKTFEHLIYEALKNQAEKYVFVEAESKRLGRNTIPDCLLYAMKSGKHLWIEATLEQRSNILVHEYMAEESHKEAICEVLEMFRKHVGNESVETMRLDVLSGKGHETAKILMEQYYDPKYEFTSNQYAYDWKFKLDTPETTAKAIAEWIKKGMPKDTLLIEAFESDISDTKLMPAAKLIAMGETVVFPTETVYGLGANALSEDAVRKIYVAKGRPSDNPLIVHIADLESLIPLVSEISETAKKLMDAFWPGALTLIFPKSDQVSLTVTAGLSTVAIRMPNHPIAKRLIELSGCPIAAPSANLSGKPSPTDYQTVVDDMTGRVGAIICGSHAKIGLESTVLDISGEEPVVLRPGGVTLEAIREVVGKGRYDEALNRKLNDGEQPKSPGMKYTHYAPEAEVVLVTGNSERVIEKITALAKKAQESGKKVGIMTFDQHVEAFDPCFTILSLGTEGDLETNGARLFTTLREFDKHSVDVVYSEGVDSEGLGKAIMNRLIKAAGHYVIEV